MTSCVWWHHRTQSPLSCHQETTNNCYRPATLQVFVSPKPLEGNIKVNRLRTIEERSPKHQHIAVFFSQSGTFHFVSTPPPPPIDEIFWRDQ